MSKETQPPCIPPKPEVLIVVAPGGILEVYTSRWMRVKIVRKLTGLPNTIEAELLARRVFLAPWTTPDAAPYLVERERAAGQE